MPKPSVYNIIGNTVIINGHEITLQELKELALTTSQAQLGKRFGISQPTVRRMLCKIIGQTKNIRVRPLKKKRKRMTEGARMALLPYEYIERVR